MNMDPRLRVDTVCFPVTDSAGQPRTLLPQVVDEVVGWLTSHGLPPSSKPRSR